MTRTLRDEMQFSVRVCSNVEPLHLVAVTDVGDCSNLDADLVVTMHWEDVYYGRRIHSQYDQVDVSPIRKVVELFDLPAVLTGMPPLV